MTKHVAISEGQAHFGELVAEIEATGNDVVITRDGMPVARLVRERPRNDEVTPEETEQRRQATLRLREIGKRLNIRATQDEIKEWINEGRH